MNNIEALLDFFLDYATFFEELLLDEKHKLQILVDGELKEIERTISIQQVNEMKLKNIEKKRQDFQEKLGFSNMTFKQIIASFEGDEKVKLQTLFTRIDSALNEVKFYNNKGMEVVSTNLHLFGDTQTSQGVYSKDSLQKK